MKHLINLQIGAITRKKRYRILIAGAQSSDLSSPKNVSWLLWESICMLLKGFYVLIIT